MTQSSKLDILIAEVVRAVPLIGRNSGSSRAATSFFAFTAYNTFMDCISLVCLFTISETTNGIIDIWNIICYIICARQFVVNITSGFFILCVQCDCLAFILCGKEKYRFSVDKVPLLWKNVHNRRIAIIERFLNRLRICQRQVKTLCRYYWHFATYWVNYIQKMKCRWERRVSRSQSWTTYHLLFLFK